MSIHAIIWDLGGVLVRTEDYRPRDELAARLGVTRQELEGLVFGNPEDYRAQVGEISYEQQWENALAHLGLPPEELPAVEQAFFAGDRLDSDLIDFIRDLKINFSTALLSNALSNLRNLINSEWKINDAFHHLIISAEVGLIKPHADIFNLTLELLGMAPHETVFIDDFPKNVEGAQFVGMHAIHFRNPMQCLADLDALIKYK
jgi:HAD superfamily hydrolase (TIGR01509 family)